MGPLYYDKYCCFDLASFVCYQLFDSIASNFFLITPYAERPSPGHHGRRPWDSSAMTDRMLSSYRRRARR